MEYDGTPEFAHVTVRTPRLCQARMRLCARFAHSLRESPLAGRVQMRGMDGNMPMGP